MVYLDDYDVEGEIIKEIPAGGCHMGGDFSFGRFTEDEQLPVIFVVMRTAYGGMDD